MATLVEDRHDLYPHIKPPTADDLSTEEALAGLEQALADAWAMRAFYRKQRPDNSKANRWRANAIAIERAMVALREERRFIASQEDLADIPPETIAKWRAMYAGGRARPPQHPGD